MTQWNKAPFHDAILHKSVKKTSMSDSVKSLWYIKYYSLSSTKDLEHSSNSINNNCQKISSRTRIEAKVSENKVTNSILKN